MPTSDPNQAILNGNTAFRDGDTLFTQNAHHPIVNMTSEIDIPGTICQGNPFLKTSAAMGVLGNQGINGDRSRCDTAL